MILLLMMQLFCHSTGELELKNGLTEDQHQTMEKSAAHLSPLDIDAFKTATANEKVDILLTSLEGNIVYWNTEDKGLKYFSSENGQSRSISKGDYTLFYRSQNPSDLSVAMRTKRNATRAYCSLWDTKTDSIFHWLSLLAFFSALVPLLLFINRKHTSRDTYPLMGLGLYITTAAIFLYASSHLQLPRFFGTKLKMIAINPISLAQLITLVLVTSFLGILISQVIRNLRDLRWFKNLLVSTAVCFLVLFVASSIRSVIHSDILCSNLDNPIQYNSAGIAFVAFLVLLAIVVFYLSVRLYSIPNRFELMHTRILSMTIGALTSGGIAMIIDPQLPIVAMITFVLAYLLILDIYIDQKRKTAVFAFLWMLIFSGFIASTIFYFQLTKDIAARKTFAQQLYTPLVSSDLNGIFQLDELIRKSPITSQLAALPYPAKLDRSDFTSFLLKQFDRADIYKSITVECFEAGGSTIFRDLFAQSALVNKTLANADRKSEYVYYNPLSASYLLSYYIENETYSESPLHLVVKIGLQEMSIDIEDRPSYQFSILKQQQIIAGSSEISTKIVSSPLKNEPTHQIQNDISYVLYEPAEDIGVYVSRRLDGLLKPISLFSFILAISGLILLLVGIVNSRYSFLPKEINIVFDYQSSLRNKIQFTIILLTIFSFVLIGLMTIIYFKNVLEQRSKQATELQITSILNNVESIVSYSDDNLSMLRVLSTKLTEVSHIHQKDLNLYDIEANLVATSLDQVTDIRLPFDVHDDVRSRSEKQVYSSAISEKWTHYIPLLDTKGQYYGTLGVLDEDASYSSSLLDFLSTVLNVYIFLFLVAGAIAVGISNSITRPLLYLSDKLKLFRLGKNQEPIKWSSKDEIGALINNFNDLATQLDESADIIAKTERDTAWREMAKQVAHEIKNPLTPMKLSIQHLQRVGKGNPDDMEHMINRVSKTLLEQFNNLDNIANSFSNFASMPQADNSKIMLNEVVEAVHDLFRKREDVKITLSEPINDLYIYADRNQVIRVLNNIVKNAVQAIPRERNGIIKMSLQQIDDMALICISDNGVGIPEDMKKKVFTPNFTTKNSGTGLGLAISANMIESFNGRIYFETKIGVGTDFYIEIPLMKINTNFEGSNRVSL